MISRRWRKSSRSVNTDTCVEVANTLDAVRDSKNAGGPVLTVANLATLVADIKASRLTS